MKHIFPQQRSCLFTKLTFILFGLAMTQAGINRVSQGGVSYFNLKTEQFSYLNITRIGSELVQDGSECGFSCLEASLCFSYNLATFSDVNGKLLCELLPSDKYNNSDKFIYSPIFNHVSILNPCSNNPCMNGATCVAKYDDDDYQCACSPGFRGKLCQIALRKDCKDIKSRGDSVGDGMYLLDPDEGSLSNAFWAYCDMTSYNGGWTMCYTTHEYVKPRTEVTYNAQFPYGSDGYRTNCNNIPFTEIMFLDRQTLAKVYFKRKTNQSMTANLNYGNGASAYELWEGVGVTDAYSYQLLICDDSFYSGFFVSGYTSCYKQCGYWCGDTVSPYFRTASTSSSYLGVAFNTNGHHSVDKRLISVGLR
ncbi:uncharacterized protein LOC111327921 [Stylophora pistillata]|uniref:uncharacterized protein LOC111327921 n=1 Tax=Stylophora pistillata TaxID=50429 RepID=UPI000C0557E4|nr:uncharacterized protein LOC111327921 [Stylophora pistillata]